jgi:hypothetical protein
MIENMDDYITIAVYLNPIEAEIAKSKLEYNGITARIKNSNTSLIGVPDIPYELQVNSNDAFIAKDILKSADFDDESQ